ncbi:MAG: hypothetical protein GXY58_01600 [Planctomycetaceae bacterium]|nr:hypothetical protein [Planctomycetaceae bacterium]
MKRALLFVAFVCLVSLGCQSHCRMANRQCQKCGPVFGRAHFGCGNVVRSGLGGNTAGSPDYVPYIPKDYYNRIEPAGPPTAAYAYPYYTVRGPRDFFLNQPSTIGY